jgi:hypothetical protein
VSIHHNRRKLCSTQHAGPNLLDEINVREERAAGPGVRVEDADGLSKLLPHYADRLQQIGVIRHDNPHLETAHMRVMQKVRCQIHIRPFLFCFHDANYCWR